MSDLINKVIYNGNTLIDLTADTITQSDLSYGKTAHDRTGATITGTNTYNADTSDANAIASQILLNRTGYVNGVKIIGTMPNHGAVTGTISTKNGSYIIAQGYHDGSGSVSISSTEQNKIIAQNIREGITILGVLGTMSGSEDVNAEAITVTPAATAQTVTPSTGYNYISQVTVSAIPYTETENAAGGITVAIG